MLVTQSCLTLCDPMDYSLPGFSVNRILQARILEWIAIPSSRGTSQPRSPALQADSLPFEPQGSLLLSLDIRQVQHNTCNNNNKRETTKNKGLLFSRSVLADSLRPHVP